jgi:hypothetical protein
MLAAWLRDAAQSLARASGCAIRGKIADRNDTDQSLVTINDRQPANLDIAHVAQDVIDLLVFEAVFHLGAHHVPHPSVRTFTLGNSTHRYIAVGDHPDKSVSVTDGQHTGIQFRHRAGSLAYCLIRIGNPNIPGHTFANSHDFLPGLNPPPPTGRNEPLPETFQLFSG